MSPSRRRLLLVAAAIGFVGLLLYNTLSAQKVSCEVCLSYKGQRNCATASHATEAEAAQSAQTTACGILASGMNESIACGRVQPETRSCHPE